MSAYFHHFLRKIMFNFRKRNFLGEIEQARFFGSDELENNY